MELLGTIAVAVAVFSLCVAVLGSSLLVPRRLDAIRAVAIPRHQYERLVSAEVPLWERIVAPVAVRLAARAPAFASQVRERDLTGMASGLLSSALGPASARLGREFAERLFAPDGPSFADGLRKARARMDTTSSGSPGKSAG